MNSLGAGKSGSLLNTSIHFNGNGRHGVSDLVRRLGQFYSFSLSPGLVADPLWKTSNSEEYLSLVFTALNIQDVLPIPTSLHAA